MKRCFCPAIQIPIQRRGRIIHVHAFFCFKCDNAYRFAVIVCATILNAVKTCTLQVSCLASSRFVQTLPNVVPCYLSAAFLQYEKSSLPIRTPFLKLSSGESSRVNVFDKVVFEKRHKFGGRSKCFSPFCQLILLCLVIQKKQDFSLFQTIRQTPCSASS